MFVEIFFFFSSNTDRQLILISFVRFLHCATSVLSREHPDVKQIFDSFLKMFVEDSTSVEFWCLVSNLIDDIVESYGRRCNSADVQIVQECFKGITCCLKEGTAKTAGKL